MNEAIIQKIDLTKDKIKEPLNAYRIDEGRYGVAHYTDARPYLITLGLSACKGVAFVNQQSHSGLLGHLAIVNDLEKVISGLVRSFEDEYEFNKADIYLIFGYHQAERIYGNWPTMDELITEVSKYKPHRLFVDDKKYTGIRGVAINLSQGKVEEVDGSNGWTWSKQQDTTSSRRIAELDI